MARKEIIRRICGLIYKESMASSRFSWRISNAVIPSAVIYTEHIRRKSVIHMDLDNAVMWACNCPVLVRSGT